MCVIISVVDAGVDNSLQPLRGPSIDPSRAHHDIIADLGDDSRSLGMCITLQLH